MASLVDAPISAKLTQSEKSRFIQTTEELGLTPSAAIRVFVKKFNACGGFPFDVVTTQPEVHIDASRVLRPKVATSGRPILPAEWDDPEDAVYDELA